MTASHITAAINQIRAMRGPGEGELRVAMRHAGQSWFDLTTPDQAEKIIRDNPRIEYQVQERWLLPD